MLMMERSTWKSTPARGPWKPRSLKSFGETVTASAALAHLDALRENDMPFIQSSDASMLVTTTCRCFGRNGIRQWNGISQRNWNLKELKCVTHLVRRVCKEVFVSLVKGEWNSILIIYQPNTSRTGISHSNSGGIHKPNTT